MLLKPSNDKWGFMKHLPDALLLGWIDAQFAHPFLPFQRSNLVEEKINSILISWEIVLSEREVQQSETWTFAPLLSLNVWLCDQWASWKPLETAPSLRLPMKGRQKYQECQRSPLGIQVESGLRSFHSPGPSPLSKFTSPPVPLHDGLCTPKFPARNISCLAKHQACLLTPESFNGQWLTVARAESLISQALEAKLAVLD